MPDHIPDPGEKRIRFGCGALFGLVASGGGIAYSVHWSWKANLIAAVVFAAICGAAAVRQGDRFWSNISEWGWPWSD